MLLSSVRVRDALLDPQPAALRQYREQVEASYRIITMAIADYQPVVSEATQRDQLRRLSSEIDQSTRRRWTCLSTPPNKRRRRFETC